jgi:hypothetical protein
MQAVCFEVGRALPAVLLVSAQYSVGQCPTYVDFFN